MLNRRAFLRTVSAGLIAPPLAAEVKAIKESCSQPCSHNDRGFRVTHDSTFKRAAFQRRWRIPSPLFGSATAEPGR